MNELKHKILVACNRPGARDELCRALEDDGHDVTVVTSLAELLRCAEKGDISLVLLELRMLAEDLRSSDSCVLLRDSCGPLELTATQLKGTIELFSLANSAPATIRETASGLLQKIDPLVCRKNPVVRWAGPAVAEIVGGSDKMREVSWFIRRAAPSRIDVLIMGESGTGKELVASAIHRLESSSERPFVSLNCASVPATLIESELFGHEKGAFTGADRRRLGKFELANGGTLFLDEIGEMSLEMQAKLLRAIELREFTRIGGETSIRCSVRLISATNKNLAEEVYAHRFREDLFYRVNVDSITLPPLRERKEDIPVLVDHFIRRLGPEMGSAAHCVTPEALSTLLRYRWPGNVRELRNCLQRSLAYCDDAAIAPEHLPVYLVNGAAKESARTLSDRIGEILASTDLSQLPENLLGDIERQLITEALKKTGWNLTKTARILGLAVNTLKKRSRDYNLVAG